MSDVESRLSQVETDVTAIKTQLKARAKKHELTLKEKLSIHDRSQGLLRWFEEITAGASGDVVWLGTPNGLTELKKAKLEDLKKIVTDLVKLVDNALGVKFP
jgi:hypothetical protein